MAKNKRGPLTNLALSLEFTSKMRQKFYTKLGQLLDNGVPLDMALEQIERSASKSKGSVLPGVYRTWRRQVSNGANFGYCVSPYVPSSEAILLEAGAESGRLAESMHHTAASVEQQAKVREAIVSNAAYPLVLLGMMIAALLLASHMIIPTFAEVLPVEQWTGISRLVAQVTFFIRGNGLPIFGTMTAVFLIIGWSMPRWTGKARVQADQMVPWSVYRLFQGSSFLLALASMMAAGVKLDEVSLAKLARKSSPYLKERVHGMRKYILSGQNLGESLYKTGYKFPDEDLIMELRIYANLRGFENNLIRIANTWVDEVVEKVTVNMKVLNFIMLVLIAITIGFLIVALYGIIQQIQDAAR